MNTPTHLMVSIAALTQRGGEDRPSYLIPAAVGAVLPDAPMYLFYAVEKFGLGSSEREIWTERYFSPGWQDFFDAFNSVPIVALGLIVSWNLGRKGWSVMFLSMLLHVACDLPLHHDDGHRHFWPVLDWRFESPVSYWDPRHFGRQAALAELVLFFGCYVWSMIKHHSLGVRVALTIPVLLMAGFVIFALIFWAGGGME